MYHVKFNAEQMAFARKEAQAWIDVQEDDYCFTAERMDKHSPQYLKEVAGMLQVLAKTQLLSDGGSMPMHPDTAYSLLCYVEFDGEERAADPEEGINIENMLDYIQQLSAVVEQGNNMRVHMIGYAVLVQRNEPDWSLSEIAEDAVEEMVHRFGEDEGREHVAGKAMAHYDDVIFVLGADQPEEEAA
jgi:hypothetical protein